MNRNREQLWQAYLDGELSAAEAAEFEASLEPEERELLAADMQFERRLGERLSEPVPCPDAVWTDIVERAKPTTLRRREKASLPQRFVWATATLAAAASLAFMISMALSPRASDVNSAIVAAATSIDELAARSEIAPTVEAADAYLRERDLPFTVDYSVDHLFPPPIEVHALKFLGMGSEQVNGETIQEAYFDCCGKPVKMLIMPRDSDAAVIVGRAMADGSDVLAARRQGEYLVAIVAEHSADELLNAVYVKQ